MAIKYKDFEKREQLRKDYIDKAAEAAKTQANAYTDEQIRNIPAPPAPDIPTALPQKYEAFKVQLVQGNISGSEKPTWEEYHKLLWSGSEVLTNSSATTQAHFITDTVLYWRSPRKYNLLITINGTEKEFVFEGEHNQYGTNWVIWQLKENNIVVAEAQCFGRGNGKYYNNTSTVFVYCPDGSSYIGQTMTAARYGKKQYLYSLMNPAAILQRPSETENARFLTMCQNIATKNAKLKLTLTDNVIEANYANISTELVTTDYAKGDHRIRWIGIVADRKPLAVGKSYQDDMPTCIKGVLEVEYTDEEATKECVYDKIQGESYTFKIGDFNHEENSAFDYYFNGAALIPLDNAQIQASFAYRPVSGEEKIIQVKSTYGAADGGQAQYLPYFDISELFGQAENTVMAIITSNTAVENEDMSARPVTTIALPSNIQNFTDANDEIMVGAILTLAPSSLPQTYKKKAVTLATSGWAASPWADIAKNTVSFSAYGYSTIGNTQYNITNTTSLAVSDTVRGYAKEPLIYQGTSTVGGLNTYMFRTADTKMSIYVGYQEQNKGEIKAKAPSISGDDTVTVYAQIDGVTTAYDYAYTDADVKVNSEVRFTLDDANGKLAGQFGLKKTIAKEAGKLTFTAETLPTSAISGTLEIGETSTEGAAFVEGIASEGIKANEENTFTAKQTFQDVQINGNLTAKGTTTTVDVKNLDVEQQLITVAKGNTAALTSPAGLKAEKYDGTKDGALVFDASGTAMVGDVVLDENGNIDETQSDLQDLATRAKPSELTDGHLLKWDATNKKIVDGGAISSGGVKTDEENTFTKTQTFNGTESQAGIKTNAIDNENGNRVVYFNGTKQIFGSGAIPTQVRTSEQRLKLERPVSGGTGTEVIEVANLEDTKEPAISSMIWNTIPGIYDSGGGQPLRRVMVWQKSQFAAGETTKEVSLAGNTHIDLSIGEPVAIGDGSVSLYIDQGQSKVTMTRIGTADARTVRWMVIGWQAVT